MYLTKAMELAGLALLATRVTAVPLNETELLEIRGDGGWGWAEFYNDRECKEGGGIAVAINNAGCLGELGRGSVKIRPGGNFAAGSAAPAALVMSPADTCDCQNHCIGLTGDGDFLADGFDECISLEGLPFAESFRFITQACSADNCA